MGFWAAAAGVIAPIAGSLLSAKQQNDSASKIAGATTDATTANSAMQLAIYQDIVQNSLPDMLNGFQRGAMALSADGLDNAAYKDAADDVLNRLGTGGGLSGEEFGSPATATAPTGGTRAGSPAYFDKLKSSGLSPSIGGSLGTKLGLNYTDPSFVNKAVAGDWQGIGEQLADPARYLMKEGLGGTWWDPAGIFGSGKSRKDRPNNAAWGTREENGEAAQGQDFEDYVDRYDDLGQSYSTFKDRDPTGHKWALASFDHNADGVLDKGEYGQMHYNLHGEEGGRTVNPLTSTIASPFSEEGGVEETAEPASPVDEWQKAFRGSGDYQTSIAFTDQNLNDLNSRFAQTGQAFSGAQQRSAAQALKAGEGGAYVNWRARLDGATPIGTINNAATNYGSQQAQNNLLNANALSRMYGSQQDMTGAAVNGLYKGISNAGWI